VRDFLLRNHSVVPVSFRMVREEDDCDNVFAITPTQGVVPFQVRRPVLSKIVNQKPDSVLVICYTPCLMPPDPFL
jgi:hypothetical protein